LAGRVPNEAGAGLRAAALAVVHPGAEAAAGGLGVDVDHGGGDALEQLHRRTLGGGEVAAGGDGARLLGREEEARDVGLGDEGGEKDGAHHEGDAHEAVLHEKLRSGSA
jgi:hypothetical protein